MPSKNQITLSFSGAKFAKSALNSLIIPRGIIAFVCLDFPKFFAVKMRSTLKSYFLGGCGEDLRRCTVRTSSKDLPKQAKKTTLRLDGIRFLLGIRINRFISAKIVSDDEWNPYALKIYFIIAEKSIAVCNYIIAFYDYYVYLRMPNKNKYIIVDGTLKPSASVA